MHRIPLKETKYGWRIRGNWERYVWKSSLLDLSIKDYLLFNFPANTFIPVPISYHNLHCFCNADPGGRASRASSISVQCTSSQFFKLQASSTFIGEDKVVICISGRLEKTCNIVEIEWVTLIAGPIHNLCIYWSSKELMCCRILSDRTYRDVKKREQKRIESILHQYALFMI